MVDFQKKIQFLYYVMYNEEINDVTKAFIPSDKPTDKELRSRKVTLKKWINTALKKEPNKFSHDYFKYPISQLHFKNKEELFPITAFSEWSITEFEERYYEYLEDKEDTNSISLVDYKYMYYYHEDIDDLAYFEIEYKKDNKVELVTNHHTQILTYTGDIIHSHDMLNFIISNEFEMMFCSFSKLDMKLNVNVYGMALSKDYNLRNPKSSQLLLSKNFLSEEEHKLFKTKINPSNVVISDNNNNNMEKSFIENLSTNLRNLKVAVRGYTSDTIFLNLFIEEFNLFYRKFYDFYNKHEFHFSSFAKSIEHILSKLIESKETHHIQILYTLKNVNVSLFSNMDDLAIELFNHILETAKKKQISFEFIISIKHKVSIDSALKDKFEQLEEVGITLRFREYRDVFSYSTLILINNYPLAISCLKGEQNYKAIQFLPDINQLRNEYKKQRNHADFLHNLIDEKYSLNGIHYLYSYGSNDELYIEEIDIDGDNIKGEVTSHHNIKYYGKKYLMYKDIILNTEYWLMKFKEEDEKKIIKIVSLLSEQHNGNRNPVVAFAILSRVKLEEEDREIIFQSMLDYESITNQKTTLKLSIHIHEILRPLLFKYEDIERKQYELNEEINDDLIP